jgi:hypothetical protein
MLGHQLGVVGGQVMSTIFSHALEVMPPSVFIPSLTESWESQAEFIIPPQVCNKCIVWGERLD